MPPKIFPKNVRSIFEKTTPESVLRSLDNDTLVKAYTEMQKQYVQLTMMKNSGQLQMSVIQSMDHVERLLGILADEIEKRIESLGKDKMDIYLNKYFMYIKVEEESNVSVILS